MSDEPNWLTVGIACGWMANEIFTRFAKWIAEGSHECSAAAAVSTRNPKPPQGGSGTAPPMKTKERS